MTRRIERRLQTGADARDDLQRLRRGATASTTRHDEPRLRRGIGAWLARPCYSARGRASSWRILSTNMSDELSDIIVLDRRIEPEEPRRLAGESFGQDRKSTRLNSSHIQKSRMPSSA